MTRTPREIMDDPTTSGVERSRVKRSVELRLSRCHWTPELAWAVPIGRRGRIPGNARLWAAPLHRDPTWEEVAAFIEEHPDGAQLEEIAAVLGVCRERVRQIEAVALRKLGEAMRGHEADVREWLASRGQMAEAE